MMQLYYSLFKECIVCGDVELALEVYQIMARDNIPHTAPVFHALTELYLGQGQVYLLTMLCMAFT